jgi:hypothetical protein
MSGRSFKVKLDVIVAQLFSGQFVRKHQKPPADFRKRLKRKALFPSMFITTKRFPNSAVSYPQTTWLLLTDKARMFETPRVSQE